MLKSFLKSFIWLPPLIALVLYLQSITFGSPWGDDAVMNQPRSKDLSLMLESFYRQLSNKNFDPFCVFQSFVIHKIFQNNAYPFGFHIYNVFLHVAFSILITLFLYKITKDKFITLLIVCLWAVHPVNVEIVTRIGIGPYHLAAAVFCLISCFSFLKLRETDKLINCFIYSFLGFFFFIASVTSIEQYLFFPIVLLLILVSLEGLKVLFQKKHLIFFIIPLLVSYPIYLLWRYTAFGGSLFYAGDYFIPWTEMGSLNEILFRAFWLAPQIIVHYFRLILWPDYLAESKADWFMVGDSLWSPYSLFCQIFVALIILSAIFLAKKNPLYSIGIAWFFFSVILIVQIVPLFSLVDEHYCYMALIGLLLAAFSLLIKKPKLIPKKIILFISIPILAFLTWRTVLYIPSEKDLFSLSLYNAAEAPEWIKSQKIAVAFVNAASLNRLQELPPWVSGEAVTSHMHEWIRRHLNEEVTLWHKYGPIQMPYNYNFYRGLFDAYREAGVDVNQLTLILNQAVRVKNSWSGWLEAANLLVKVNDCNTAWEFYKLAAETNPTKGLIYGSNFIRSAILSNHISEAETIIFNYIKLRSNQAYPYLFAGEFYRNLNNKEKAMYYYKLAVSPDKLRILDEKLYLTVAKVFAENKMYDWAYKAVSIILVRNPLNAEAKKFLASLKKQ